MNNPEQHTDPFEFLCAALSPCTPDDEIRELQRIAAAGEVDWPAVAERANRADLAPALCVALEAKGLMSDAPQLFREYLRELHRFNLDRNQALLRQLREVVRLLNDIGVTPLLLKGAAALATDLYPDPGMRFMADLDLLVPEDALEQSVAALRANGYEVPEKCQRLVHLTASKHYPPLVHPEAPAAVELHRRVLNAGRDLLESTRVWDTSLPYRGNRLPGLSAAIMSLTDEVIYCFAHSELGHGFHHYERMDARHLLDFACLIRCFRDEIEWSRLDALKHHPRYGRAFEIYLCQVKMLFRLDLPLSGSLSPAAERHFRRMTSSLGWRDRQRRLLRLMTREVYVMFSKERMYHNFDQKDVSLWRLRLRHLRWLLGRYWRPGAWRARLGRLKPH